MGWFLDLFSSYWTVGGITLVCAIAGALMLTPFGAPVLSAFMAFADTKIGRWIIAGGGAVLALLVALAGARQKGRDEARQEQEKRDAEAVQKAKQVEADTNAMTGDKAREELTKWGRR